jgi:hypothetical protein
MNSATNIRQGFFLRAGPAVFSAAATAIAGFIRLAIGDEKVNWVPPSGQASPIPPITERLIEYYIFHGARDQDVADRFLIELTELHQHYANVIRASRAMHHITLAKAQFDLARKPNSSVLNLLCRFKLGQSAAGSEAEEKVPSLEEDAL